MRKKKKKLTKYFESYTGSNAKYAMLRTIGKKKKERLRKNKRDFPWYAHYSIDFHCVILASK